MTSLSMRTILPMALLITAWISPAWAQDLAVQQPVVRQFGVGTSVSVPDRGRAYLGGVRKGAMGTNRYGGPFRSGTNSGLEHSNSSMSVSVYIHDFEAMDEALLNAAENRSAGNRSPGNHSEGPALNRRQEKPLSPRAANAWRSLEARHARR